MNQTFGLSWDHGKRKLAAAIALLLIAITMAVAPAASSLEAKKSVEVVVTDSGAAFEVQTSSFYLRGSTWG